MEAVIKIACLVMSLVNMFFAVSVAGKGNYGEAAYYMGWAVFLGR